MKKALLFIFMSLFVVLTGCSQDDTSVATATKIDSTKHVCAECNMKVMDNEFATQIILENDDVLYFDDIGCMLAWKEDNKGKKLKAELIRDYTSKEWIEAKNAHFLTNTKVKTPMGYGILSFKDEDTAKKEQKKNADAELVNYDTLIKLSASSGGGHQHGNHQHGDMHKDCNHDGKGCKCSGDCKCTEDGKCTCPTKENGECKCDMKNKDDNTCDCGTFNCPCLKDGKCTCPKDENGKCACDEKREEASCGCADAKCKCLTTPGTKCNEAGQCVCPKDEDGKCGCDHKREEMKKEESKSTT